MCPRFDNNFEYQDILYLYMIIYFIRYICNIKIIGKNNQANSNLTHKTWDPEQNVLTVINYHAFH